MQSQMFLFSRGFDRNMNFRYEIATAASGFAMTKIQLVYFSSKLSMTFVTINQKFRKSLRLSGLFTNCGCPRSIAAAVGAKNMPPAYFLNAPTVLQEIICFSYEHSKTQKPQRFLGFLFALKYRFDASPKF